jgi:hypothetical protein
MCLVPRRCLLLTEALSQPDCGSHLPRHYHHSSRARRDRYGARLVRRAAAEGRVLPQATPSRCRRSRCQISRSAPAARRSWRRPKSERGGMHVMSWADTTGAADLLVVPRPRPCRRAGHVPGTHGRPLRRAVRPGGTRHPCFLSGVRACRPPRCPLRPEVRSGRAAGQTVTRSLSLQRAVTYIWSVLPPNGTATELVACIAWLALAPPTRAATNSSTRWSSWFATVGGQNPDPVRAWPSDISQQPWISHTAVDEGARNSPALTASASSISGTPRTERGERGESPWTTVPIELV